MTTAVSATPDEPEQTSLYSIAPSDMLKRIEERRKAWVKVKQQIAKNLDERKELRRQEQKAYAEFLEATGGGVQEVIDEEDERDALAVHAGDVMTASAVSEKRRAKIVAAAEHVLSCAGGRMDNTMLAAYLNLDAHGVAGYLSEAPTIRKEYNGRVGNGKLEWVLVAKDGGE